MSTHLTLAARRGAQVERFERRRRDIARYLLGVTVCSAGVALAIDSGLGAAPYDAVLTGIARWTAIPYWLTAWVLTAMWIVVVKSLDGKISIRQIVHGALFGPVIEFFLWLLPSPSSPAPRVLYGFSGVLAIAIGIHLFLSARLISGVFDTLFETVAERIRVSPHRVRLVFDVLSVVAGFALGGAIGPLTIAVAVSVAPILGFLHTFDERRSTVRSWRGIRLAD